jgi:hypothetical protein
MRITDQTIQTNEITVEQIDIYKFFTVHNVVSYTNSNFDSWIINTMPKNGKHTQAIYFIIDTLFNQAFAHWVYESAIYLDLFIILKKRYPALQLHLKLKRKFKLLFCSIFNIKEEDIVYRLQPNNMLIFPSPISMLNNPEITPEYIEQLRTFFIRFNSYKSQHKTKSILIMPRQINENNKGNERYYDMSKITKYFEESIYLYEFLNTDSIEDIKEQIQRVSSANTIILTTGSPFLVNGMFSYNSRILIIDILTVEQYMNYKKIKQIMDNIKEMNNTTYEHYSNTDDLYTYLCNNKISE